MEKIKKAEIVKVESGYYRVYFNNKPNATLEIIKEFYGYSVSHVYFDKPIYENTYLKHCKSFIYSFLNNDIDLIYDLNKLRRFGKIY
jgi:hypothetical protein